MKDGFYEKAQERLKNIVGDWKDKWRLDGDDAKPVYISDHVWRGLTAYWRSPKSVKTSAHCSNNRMTRDAEGNLPLPHTSGQTPHAGKALEIVSTKILIYFFKFLIMKLFIEYIYSIFVNLIILFCRLLGKEHHRLLPNFTS